MLDDTRFDTNPQFDTRPEPPRDAAAAAYLRANPGASHYCPDEASVNAALRRIRLRLTKLKSSRPPSPSGMFVDDLVEELKKQGFEEFVIRWAIHQGRASGFWNVGWLLRTDPVGDGSVRHREGQYIQSATHTPPCSVDLSGPCPIVFGKAMKRLAERTRFVVQILIDAYSKGGLTTKELNENYAKRFGTKGSPVRLLTHLRQPGSAWERAILTPGEANMGGKYSLAPDA